MAASLLRPLLSGADPRPHRQVRLICFPPAGGGPSVFRSWPPLLPEHIEVCPLHLPGRENRIHDPLFDRMEPIIEESIEQIGDASSMPLALFGHSMGSLIAFEVARRLRRRGGATPAVLFVSGHRAPHLPPKNRPIHRLPRSEFLSELVRLSGTQPEVLNDTELCDLLLPTLRADFAVCEAYRHRCDDPLACPVIAFAGNADPYVSPHEMEAWQLHTNGPFRLHVLPGDHFFFRGASSTILAVIADEVLAVTASANSSQV